MIRRNTSAGLTLLAILVLFVEPALAQEGGGSGALGDVVVNALIGFLKEIFSPIVGIIERQGSALLDIIVSTPHPNAVFDKPTNNAWPRLYDFYWRSIVPLSLSLYGLAIGIVILLETTSHLFSSYHRSKLKKRAVSGLLGILSWWWIAAISLRFMDALTGVLIPSLSNITLFETASFSSIGVLGLVLSLGTDLVLFILLAVIYATRHLVLYLFVLMMPILMVFWIPGVGPFGLAARFVKKLAGFYVPFLFMTVPVAILFRLGDILGHSLGPSMGGIGAWLTAIIIPFAAVLAPIVLFWQAGGIFFLGDRISSRVSAQQAQSRIARTRDVQRTASHGGRNFARGVRGEPAVKPGGQTVLDSGDSTAHATGKRLSPAGTNATTATSDSRTPSDSSSATTDSRVTDFEMLHDRSANSTDGDDQSTVSDSDTDTPRYFH